MLSTIQFMTWALVNFNSFIMFTIWTSIKQSFRHVILTLRWPREGGSPPNRFFLIFLRNGKSFLGKPKFLPVGSSLGHLSMKNFSDQTYCLGSKIRQRKICLSQTIGFFHKNYTLAYFALFFGIVVWSGLSSGFFRIFVSSRCQ